MTETETEIEKNLDLLAEGLWARLRDILLAQSRWDGFVRDPEGGQLQAVPPPDDRERVASEMVLRALHVAVDPVNNAILHLLAGEERVAIASLMEQTGLSRIGVIERVNDLSQVGLASYEVEAREARATAGASGLLGLFDDVSERLTRILEKRWNADSR
ncbi:MAG TPA: hypothetical protein VEZ11_18790 [Thermoanaerobaculia bacterium]|nr:hypothetical protein [Thermoanaerobaculia bacterium]